MIEETLLKCDCGGKLELREVKYLENRENKTLFSGYLMCQRCQKWYQLTLDLEVLPTAPAKEGG